VGPGEDMARRHPVGGADRAEEWPQHPCVALDRPAGSGAALLLVIVLAAGVPLPATDTPATASPTSRDPGIGPVLLVLAGLAGGTLAVRRFRRTA
jgi:hypothetical protein